MSHMKPNLILLIAMLLVLSGCESDTEQTDTPTSEQVAEYAASESAPEEADAMQEEKTTGAYETGIEYPPLDFSLLPEYLSPCGFALDGDALLITDSYSKKIWRLSPEGAEVYAGDDTTLDIYGEPLGGYNDADADASFFRMPWAISPFLDGYVVSDTDNNALRLIREGRVETVNAAMDGESGGKQGAVYNHPTGLATDDAGNIYVSDTNEGKIAVINFIGEYHVFLDNLNSPMGLAYHDGYLYIAETGNNRILRAQIGDPYRDEHESEIVAGSGEVGDSDGEALQASFSSPMGIAASDDGSLFVADSVNGRLRRISDGQVTTIDVTDPAASEVELTTPVGICIRGKEIYVADNFGRRIFVIPYEE